MLLVYPNVTYLWSSTAKVYQTNEEAIDAGVDPKENQKYFDFYEQVTEMIDFAVPRIFEMNTQKIDISVNFGDLGFDEEGNEILVKSPIFYYGSFLSSDQTLDISVSAASKTGECIRQVIKELYMIRLGLSKQLQQIRVTTVENSQVYMWNGTAFSARLMPPDELPWIKEADEMVRDIIIKQSISNFDEVS